MGDRQGQLLAGWVPALGHSPGGFDLDQIFITRQPPMLQSPIDEILAFL